MASNWALPWYSVTRAQTVTRSPTLTPGATASDLPHRAVDGAGAVAHPQLEEGLALPGLTGLLGGEQVHAFDAGARDQVAHGYPRVRGARRLFG